MPKISDLTEDTAPDGADLVPVVDTSAGTTDKVTLTNLAASSAFAGQYASPVATADAVLYVSTEGNDSNNGKSWGKAFATLEAAYAALPATGGRIEVGAGTFTLAATGATTGFTIERGKPVGIKGVGRMLTQINYTGTGIAVMIGDGTSFLDWGYFEDLRINCTNHAVANTGVKLDDAHRGYFNRVAITSGGNTAGSTAFIGVDAFQNYFHGCLLYGFEDGVELLTASNDFTLLDTSVSGTGVCVRVLDSHNVRIEGGQISDAATGVQVDCTSALASYGFQLLNTHFEGNTLDVKIGPNATSTQAVTNPTISCPLPSGITIDRAVQPFVATTMVATGKTITLTANCSDAFLIYTLNGGTLSDSGLRTSRLVASGAGRFYLGNLFATGAVEGGSYKASNGSPAYDFNPATGSGTFLRSLVGAEANERFGVTWAGQIAWGAGGGSGTDVTISRKGAGALGVGGAIAPGVTRQTLASAGNVNFDLRYGQIYIQTLNANATSSAISGGTAVDGQHMTIEFVQGASAPFTAVWPTNCLFAGGAAPTMSTVAGYRDRVSFIYDSTAAKWVETSRSLAIR